MTQTALTFTADIVEVPVTIGDKRYILREANGEAAIQYKNALAKATVFKDGKVTSIAGINDAEPLLVSLCLFNEDGSSVHVKIVRNFKNSTLEALFDKAKEISNLDTPVDETCNHEKCDSKHCPHCGEQLKTEEDEAGND